VTGLGGHAAEPHKAVDTTLVAAQIVVTLHSIVSRSVDPLRSVVLTVGTFQTDSGASNIIAHNARMEGTVRCLHPDDRADGGTHPPRGRGHRERLRRDSRAELDPRLPCHGEP
jgi:metal-dependent amidase/aminoacylase/carboxypeptidase family protein